MSFTEMKVEELKEVAEEFGTDLPDNATKKVILAALVEDGVTFDLYRQSHPVVEGEEDEDEADETEVVVEEKPAKVKKAKQILVRMNRQNGTYQTHGYTFTKAHPFCLVNEDDFQAIMDSEEDGSFRQATPKEAEDFYS